MKEKIIETVGRVLEIEADENTSQTNCTEWDSLGHLNLIIELEMEFDVSFEPEEIAGMKSIELIDALIKQKLS